MGPRPLRAPPAPSRVWFFFPEAPFLPLLLAGQFSEEPSAGASQSRSSQGLSCEGLASSRVSGAEPPPPFPLHHDSRWVPEPLRVQPLHPLKGASKSLQGHPKMAGGGHTRSASPGYSHLTPAGAPSSPLISQLLPVRRCAQGLSLTMASVHSGSLHCQPLGRETGAPMPWTVSCILVV